MLYFSRDFVLHLWDYLKEANDTQGCMECKTGMIIIRIYAWEEFLLNRLRTLFEKDFSHRIMDMTRSYLKFFCQSTGHDGGE